MTNMIIRKGEDLGSNLIIDVANSLPMVLLSRARMTSSRFYKSTKSLSLAPFARECTTVCCLSCSTLLRRALA